MIPFIVAGATQLISATTSPAATAITASGSDYFLIQAGASVVSEEFALFKFGGGSDTITASTAVLLPGGMPGFIVRRKNAKSQTHLVHQASAAMSIYLTPVIPC